MELILEIVLIAVVDGFDLVDEGQEYLYIVLFEQFKKIQTPDSFLEVKQAQYS